MPVNRNHVLAELRDAIRRLERRPARREGVVASGLAEVDALLAGGGFPMGALSELVGGPASGKTVVALSVFAQLAAPALFAWVDARAEIYPPAAAAHGVDLARLLVVRPAAGVRGEGARAARDDDPALAALWAAEALLASGAFAAVAVDVPVARLPRGADAAARRLQAAAERGGAVGLWLSGPGATVRIPAAARLELSTEGGRITARRTLGAEPRLDGLAGAGPRGAPVAPGGRVSGRRAGHAA